MKLERSRKKIKGERVKGESEKRKKNHRLQFNAKDGDEGKFGKMVKKWRGKREHG